MVKVLHAATTQAGEVDVENSDCGWPWSPAAGCQVWCLCGWSPAGGWSRWPAPSLRCRTEWLLLSECPSSSAGSSCLLMHHTAEVKKEVYLYICAQFSVYILVPLLSIFTWFIAKQNLHFSVTDVLKSLFQPLSQTPCFSCCHFKALLSDWTAL